MVSHIRVRHALRQAEEEDQQRAPPATPAAPAQALRLLPPKAARLCFEAMRAEAEHLPRSRGEELLARHRVPKSRSEAMLRSGATLDNATKAAALQVVEKWVGILRPLVPREEIPRLLCTLVHGDAGARGYSPSSPSGRSAPVRAAVDRPEPNPVPPPEEPLGAALRRVVPLPSELLAEPWAFVAEILEVLVLEESSYGRGPGGGERSGAGPERKELRLRPGGAEIVSKYEAPFLVAKEHTKTEGGGPGRRAPLSVDKKLRLSADFAWSGFQEDTKARATCFAFSPQVFCSRQGAAGVPGPGLYEKPATPSRRSHRAEFPAVGQSRIVGCDASMSQRGRFFFPRGDPWNPYGASEEL